jgi:hypothetical protein
MEAAVDVGDVGVARRGALEEERAHERGRSTARRAHPGSAPGVADDGATCGTRGSADRTASGSAPRGSRDLAGISIGTRCIRPFSTSFDVTLGDLFADAPVMGVRVEDGFGASTSERNRGGESDNSSLPGSGIHRSGSDAMGQRPQRRRMRNVPEF